MARGEAFLGCERRKAMRHTWKIVAIGMFLVFCAPFAVAQMPMTGQMQRHGPMMGQGMPQYNAATEATLKGTVEAVNQMGMSGMQGRGGTHLTVKTEKESIEVRVGPTWFLEQNKMTFAKGDPVEVSGSRVKFGTADVLIAREIKKGGQALTLRDAKGVPAWQGKGTGMQHRHMS
jgi:hypothetical protein